MTQTNPPAAEGCVETPRPALSRTLVLKEALMEEEKQERTGKKLRRWAHLPPFIWGFLIITVISHLFPRWITRDPHTASHEGKMRLAQQICAFAITNA